MNEPTVQVSSEAMEPLASTGLVHVFHATAFVENLSLKDLATVYPEARRRPHELFYLAVEQTRTFRGC